MGLAHQSSLRETRSRLSSPPVAIERIHTDDRFIVIDKPSGLLSVPGIGPEKADCLVSRLQEPFPGCRIVHRLDRDTSGIMVLARDAEAHRHLSIQFQDRLVQKVYQAVVAGSVNEPSGQIDLPIAKDRDNAPRQKIDHEHGRSAQTDWTVLSRDDDRTRLELRPLTGRSHQLRLHLLEIGHPILGDDLYAPPDALAAADRLLLHATNLSFTHPESGQTLAFESNCPF
jgi:tRNA pseudouridine32 synthase/23S rRNA pseudouridine746 synthase